MTIEERIKKVIAQAHEADPLRGIGANESRVLSDLLARKRYDIRQGKVTDRNGIEVNLQADVEQVINTSYYIGRPSNADAKFVSRWPQPTKEQRDSIARDTRVALDKLSKIYGLVPIDQEGWDKGLDLLSKNMVFGFDDAGEVTFAKFNPSGLIGEKRYSFNDILPTHLLDREQTSLAQELKNANYKDLAVKLLGRTNPKPEYVNEKIKSLRKQEIVNSIPRKQLPYIPPSVLESDFKNREALIRGIDPNVRGGNDLAILQRAARQELQKLDDVSELDRELKQIKPNPLDQWKGLPGYE